MTAILAIDDSPTIRAMLEGTLSRAGFDVTLAEDGVEGLSAHDDTAPDLIITDVNMPNLDGFGVIDGIRKDRGNMSTPILVLTTETGSQLRSRARDAGASGWITKPFDPEKLIAVIQRLTGAEG
ncbi:MAG: two-component system response regulator [Rhodobacterales bacterium]|nr:MAG: two-component system response regulator [Rhodobacterales bacterium]